MELTVKMAEDFEKNIKTSEVKKALEAVAVADPTQKNILMQKAASDLNAKFNCPEFNDFIERAKQSTINPSAPTIEPEGNTSGAL